MAVSAPDALYFTNSDEANELLASEPLALLIGFALDQQVPVQTAFSGPHLSTYVLPANSASLLSGGAVAVRAKNTQSHRAVIGTFMLQPRDVCVFEQHAPRVE